MSSSLPFSIIKALNSKSSCVSGICVSRSPSSTSVIPTSAGASDHVDGANPGDVPANTPFSNSASQVCDFFFEFKLRALAASIAALSHPSPPGVKGWLEVDPRTKSCDAPTGRCTPLVWTPDVSIDCSSHPVLVVVTSFPLISPFLRPHSSPMNCGSNLGSVGKTTVSGVVGSIIHLPSSRTNTSVILSAAEDAAARASAARLDCARSISAAWRSPSRSNRVSRGYAHVAGGKSSYEEPDPTPEPDASTRRCTSPTPVSAR